MELKRLGKYEIVAKIGEGGMGEVHRAHDPVLNRDVAIKTLASSGDAAGDLRRRFHREAQSAARLNHPNIVTVHDFGEEQGQMYIAMELLEGSDLREVIRRRRPMALVTKLDLMDQICDGLAFAHARDVIHRDLKPANIHLLPNGRVKIMDFGLARISSASDLTGAGIMLGTPNYMSPEQVRGEKATTRSDVFSLGLVFYELLSGRKAFDADTIAGVLLQVVQVEPEPLERLRAEVALPVARVVHRAMAKDPASRFAHAGELGEALRDARPAPSPAPRLQRPPSPASRGDALSNAATLTRPIESLRSTGAGQPETAKPSPAEGTAVPVRTHQPEPIAALTVNAAAVPTTVVPTPTAPLPPIPEPVARPEPSEHRTPDAAPAPRPVPSRRAPSPTALLGVAMALIGLAFAARVAVRPTSERPAAGSATRPQPTFAPPTLAPAPPSAPPSPSIAPPKDAPGPRLADAERSLREKDYRAALRVSEAVLARDPGAPAARRVAEQARRALRASDGIVARLGAALDAHDVEKASQALSELLDQDPRRPDASALAARLNSSMALRRQELATPAPAPPTIPAPTPAPAPSAPPPTAPATALPALQSEAAARQAIRGVLDEYRAAFERRDADSLRAVQPDVDYARMKDRFASVTGYTVRIDVKEVTVDGDQGTATCIVTYLPQPKPSQKIPPQRTVFHLRRTGDVWLIERLEAKQR